MEPKETPLRTGPRGTFVFIHINKTGGTSIARAIGLSKKLHLSAVQVIELIGREAWSSAYKFAFVRNPWDKLVSQYKYRRRRNQTPIAELGIEFKDWVARTLGEPKDPRLYVRPHLFRPQVDWLKDEQGRIEIERIGRFETLATDFSEIQTELGLTGPLPHLNRSSDRTPYQDYYDAETRALVARCHQEDIELFGYRF